MASVTAFPSTGNEFDPARAYKVLICDLIGLKLGPCGQPDPSEAKAYIESRGGAFHFSAVEQAGPLKPGALHFFYQPDLSTGDELMAAAGKGQYDAVIAAATVLPAGTIFPLGGVRIGAGTGNMGSLSWGGGGGEGGTAPLMNTPGINSRATAQMVLKAILKVLPDLRVDVLHDRVARGDFDTGRDLRDYPTEKLEGKTIAVIGYGNIGREVAKLARAFGMHVVIHARARHRRWIEAEGFVYGETIAAAAAGAHVLSVHVGLGSLNAETGRYANAGLVNSDVLSAMAQGAVVVNYDRGELVDVDALANGLATGQVRHAAIDADLFKTMATGELSGPMVPYLRLVGDFPDSIELLPHAAADTDHPSRVAGARQAVDQVYAAIVEKKVTNLKGTLPAGYRSAGSKTPDGIGAVTVQRLVDVFQSSGEVSELAALLSEQARLWSAVADASDEDRAAIAEANGERLMSGTNRLSRLIEAMGLTGPYQR
ncbi:phosphoglycerate dehydrogenase [Rhizobium sp. CG5]|uniref:NAD(P)-dependent oxidoreductase n=1 Tax=Rhizobium sp. CG5 TaxID=2726076 RepID=UPI00203456C0|nr:NAD(P)-dependent oxidoreductase [Rhizobium sp. CG5]MCM2477100.1 phosphoglycerate dehydrogenase [Rhizobium sp. CG5]